MESTDPDRFAVRSTYLAGVGRMPWLTWRSKEIAALYAELNATVRATAPAVGLAVVTPGLDGGPAGSEARRVDRAALPPSQSWRSVGLDLQAWPSGPGSPLVLRGTALSTEALSHDLATSPDLDSLVAVAPASRLAPVDRRRRRRERSRRRCAGRRKHRRADCPALPGSSAPLEPDGAGRPMTENAGRATDKRGPSAARLAHRTAPGRRSGRRRAARARTGGTRCAVGLPGRKGRLRPGRTAAQLRAGAPRPSRQGGTRRTTRPTGSPRPFGVVVRSIDDGPQTFLEIANNSPYPVRLAGRLDLPAAAPIEDLGRGLRLVSMPRPTAAIWCSTCYHTASPRSGSRRRRSSSPR